MNSAIILMALTICILSVAVTAASEGSTDNNTTGFWNNRGDVLLYQYKYEDALDAYNNALKINGSNIAALVGQGYALVGLGRYNESLESFQKAILISPLNARAWTGKGITLHGLGRYNESLQSYDRALEIDPMYASAWNDKAWMYYKRGNNEEAIKNVDRAIDILSINLAAALDTKGVALAALGRNEDALDYINRSIELDPSDSILWIHKGDVLKTMGRESEAQSAYAKAKELPAQYLGGESV